MLESNPVSWYTSHMVLFKQKAPKYEWNIIAMLAALGVMAVIAWLFTATSASASI